MWNDPKLLVRDGPRYRHFAPIKESSETHGGDDVTVYAIGRNYTSPCNVQISYDKHAFSGPHSHLFNGVFEQSYIAHAISCATKMGPSAKYCKSAAISANSSLPLVALLVLAQMISFIK